MSKMLTSGISGILLCSKTIQTCVIEQCCESVYCSYKWLVYSNSFSSITSKRCICCRLLIRVTSKRGLSLCTHRHGHNTYVHTGMDTTHMYTQAWTPHICTHRHGHHTYAYIPYTMFLFGQLCTYTLFYIEILL